MLIVASTSRNHLKHSKFSSLGIGVSTNCVARNTLEQKFSGMFTLYNFFHNNLSSTIWIWDFHVLAAPKSHPSHLILGKGSGLIRADIVRSTHNFTRRKSLDEVLILKHLLDRVCKRDHYSKWKTFWYSDDNNSYSNNNMSKPFFNVFPESSGTFIFRIIALANFSVCWAQFSTE
jgi:hypothetical protein